MAGSKIPARARQPRILEQGGSSAKAAARSDEPLYGQVARALKDDIIGGVYPVGAQLPTEDELCGRFAVSRFTVREALRRLREGGLVASRQGAGTVVIAPQMADAYVLHATSIADLVAFANGTRLTIDTIGMIAVDAKLAATIGVAVGEEWLAVRGYRHADGNMPVCWTEYYINRDFASVARLLRRHNGPFFSLIEDMFALSIAEVHQEIAAVTLSPALAEGLKVKPGAAALEVQRTYRIADGRVAQVTVNLHPASRFRHAMTLRQVKA